MSHFAAGSQRLELKLSEGEISAPLGSGKHSYIHLC